MTRLAWLALARLALRTWLAGLSGFPRLARLGLMTGLARPPLLLAIELNRLTALLVATAGPLVARRTPLGFGRVLRRELAFLIRHDGDSFRCICHRGGRILYEQAAYQ